MLIAHTVSVRCDAQVPAEKRRVILFRRPSDAERQCLQGFAGNNVHEQSRAICADSDMDGGVTTQNFLGAGEPELT
jgi:hypothetical protein